MIKAYSMKTVMTNLENNTFNLHVANPITCYMNSWFCLFLFKILKSVFNNRMPEP